ncbi:YaiO family outer membrane beta-barrel protein [Spongiimicrobium sp. 3-5]|uniref:YaiO family outer membrane beta-barrel protein n=1 Tax=Spongiimicrobium sp. 3-5 TaxID=3332596 RepID=UPI00397F8806
MTAPLLAQEVAYAGDPDASFLIARDLAFDNNRIKARDTLKHILTTYPNYTDVRELLAKTYSWDGEYTEARKEFNKITSTVRDNKAVWIAAVKNEIYAKNYPTALGLVNKGLKYLQGDTDLLQLRNKVLLEIDKGQAALSLAIRDSLEIKTFKNRVGLTNAFEVFDIVYEPMFNSSLEYRRDTRYGSAIPRINYSNRFDLNGLQYEVDLYPKFSKTFYGYLNYGYSDASIFPNHRIGAELYANLPKSIEASLGARYLDFTDSKATIFTGSLGLYRGNYYFSMRPYITPRSDNPTSFSGSLLARKYLRDGENYFGINLVYGNAPELKQLLVDDVLLAESLLYIESQQILLEYQFTPKDRPNIYRAHLGLNRQELVFDEGTFFWAVTAGINYQTKF